MAFGNVSAERRAIESTYEDVADILRNSPEKDERGITRNILTEVYGGIPCALSRSSNSSAQQIAQTVDHSEMLFAAPEYDIHPGDTAKVTRFGKLREFEVLGISDVYATHQEIHLKEHDLA